MCETRGIGHAVVIVLNRVDARAVAVARTRQAIEGPQIGCADGKAGRSVASHGAPAHILQKVFGAFDISSEVCLIEVRGTLMAVAVAGDFVTLVRNSADQLGVTLSDPAEREERGLGLVPIKHRKNAIDVAFDPAFTTIPIAARDVGREGGHLKVVLDVDRQGVANRVTPTRGGRLHHRPSAAGSSQRQRSAAIRSAA